MGTYTIKTAGGWTYTGVNEWELKRKLEEIARRGDKVISMVKDDSGTPVKYNLDTVYFAGVRDKVKREIATKDPKYRQKALELAKKYREIAKSDLEDAKRLNIPEAGKAGLRRSAEDFLKKAQELERFARGGGPAPKWFAKLMVHEVTSADLAKLSPSTKHEVNLKTGFYVPEPRAPPKPVPKLPAPPKPVPKPPVIKPPVLERLEKDTGIKTVPKPKPGPVLIAKRVPTNSKPHTVHVTTVQESKKIDAKKVGLGLLGLAVLYYLLRRG